MSDLSHFLLPSPFKSILAVMSLNAVNIHSRCVKATAFNLYIKIQLQSNFDSVWHLCYLLLHYTTIMGQTLRIVIHRRSWLVSMVQHRRGGKKTQEGNVGGSKDEKNRD